MQPKTFIPVNTPLLSGNEKKYLNECIDTGWISSEGPFVKKFEDKFAKKVNRRHAIAVANGTAAIDIAVESLNIGRGDEVILPSFTIISCINQIVRSGAIPVLVDSDINTWNMDVNQIESKITSKTKAILVVHIYGLPVDIDPILQIAKKYDLKIIEDAAEMIGQTYKGKPCGSFGDISTFSFYSNKHITTGEGGMVVMNDDNLAYTCRSLRNLCFQPDKRFVHERLGWNYRMTNMQAALGLAQLEVLDSSIKKKRQMGSIYNQNFKDLIGLQLPQVKTEFAENIYWVYGLLLVESVNFNAKVAMKKLNQKGIGCRPFFYPMHQQPFFKEKLLFTSEKLHVSELLYRRGFYIPSGLGLKEGEIYQVVEAVREVFK
jgi:perosamine synthetase